MGSDFTTQTESRELSNISDFQFMKLKTNLQKKSSTENLNSNKAKRNEMRQSQITIARIQDPLTMSTQRGEKFQIKKPNESRNSIGNISPKPTQTD
jgi:hypothetical protein